MRKSATLFAAVGLLALSGCASIVSSSEWPVTFTSTPDSANVEVEDENGVIVHRGTTPCTVTLDASDGFWDRMTYTVRFHKDGCGDCTEGLYAGMNPWYLGNLVFGGIPGHLIVDPLTGAMWKLPKECHGNLVAPTSTE